MTMDATNRGDPAGGYAVRVSLGELLERRGVTPYRLAAAAAGQVARGSIYALSRGDAERVDLGTLGRIMGTLERLTGEPVALAELLKVERPA